MIEYINFRQYIPKNAKIIMDFRNTDERKFSDKDDPVGNLSQSISKVRIER